MRCTSIVLVYIRCIVRSLLLFLIFSKIKRTLFLLHELQFWSVGWGLRQLPHFDKIFLSPLRIWRIRSLVIGEIFHQVVGILVSIMMLFIALADVLCVKRCGCIKWSPIFSLLDLSARQVGGESLFKEILHVYLQASITIEPFLWKVFVPGIPVKK